MIHFKGLRDDQQFKMSLVQGVIVTHISDLFSNSNRSGVAPTDVCFSQLEKQLTNYSLVGGIKNGDVIFLQIFYEEGRRKETLVRP